jgi:polygalacturonase
MRKLILSAAMAAISLSLLIPPPDAGASPAVMPASGRHTMLPAEVPLVANVKDYGATGNGRTNDAPSINKAIRAVAAAGGGTVVVPAGTYLSGSIRLMSHIHLVLSPGAVLQATSEIKAYDEAEPNQWDHYQDYGHSHWHNGFIWGEGLVNVSITGTGMIFGKGLTRNHASDSLPVGLGDKAIALKNCRDVVLRDFSIYHGGHFGILATGVDNLRIDHLTIDTNRDGMDIDACRNVTITGCQVNSPWDDGICLKSSFALGYARATENVAISDDIVSGFDEGALLDPDHRLLKKQTPRDNPIGRIKLGTESNGGFKNIAITNCIFEHCRGLALETVDGGSLEEVSVSNITMRDIGNAPLFIRLGSRMRGPAGVPVGIVRKININGVVVSNSRNMQVKTGCVISGVPGHDIRDVRITNVDITYQGEGTAQDAAVNPPEKENAYPEPNMFGTMPSYGFYVRHAAGIDFSDIHLGYASADHRPAFVLDDVQDASFHLIKAVHENGVPVILLKSAEDVHIYDSRDVADRHITTARNLKL